MLKKPVQVYAAEAKSGVATHQQCRLGLRKVVSRAIFAPTHTVKFYLDVF